MVNPLEQLAGGSGRSDPLTSFSFSIEIDGICHGRFSEARGLQWRSETLSFAEGGNLTGPVILPGPGKFTPLTLKRGFIAASRELVSWMKSSSRPTREPQARTSISIIINDDKGEETGRFNLFGAFLSAYSGPVLDSNSSRFLFEEIEIIYESFDFCSSNEKTGALQAGFSTWK